MVDKKRHVKYFYLHEDKERIPGPTPWVEAGVYPVVRLFDKDRVLVDVSKNEYKQITLLRLKDGEIISPENGDKQIG